MSDHVSKHSHDEETTSRASSEAPQPSWTSHWIKGKSKAMPVVDRKSCLAPSWVKRKDSPSRPGKKMSIGNGKMLSGSVGRTMTEEALDPENGISNSPSPTLRLGQVTDSSTISPRLDSDSSPETMSLALVLGKKANPTELNQLGSSSSALPHPTKPVKVFERHFSNDNFTSFDRENCKYQKYPSIVFDDKKMKNDLSSEFRQKDGLLVQHGKCENKNFQALFKNQQSRSVQRYATDVVFRAHGSLANIDQVKSHYGFHPLADRFPSSLHNVETMVDSVQSSPGGPHMMSQRFHHVLFTEDTCVNKSKHHVLGEPSTSPYCEEKSYARPYYSVPTHTRGVQIHSLSLSTESGPKENAGTSVSKAGSRDGGSAETDGMQVDAPDNQDAQLDMASSSLQKDDNVHEDSSSAACESNKEKTGRKKALVEIPDMNDELPGLQPELSTTDGRESSASRVHSFDAKQLFPCGEQASKSESNQNSPAALEASSRWIKRLKLNASDSVGVGTKSSDMGEGLSHEKFNTFFNRIMKCDRESPDHESSRHLGKHQVALSQNVELLGNDGSSSMVPKKRGKSLMQGCSWIQRWSQRNTASLPKNPEPQLICEPHRLKFGQDDHSKKQFPSIGALALMGKAMSGFRSCEFKKSGSVTVWNTKEF